MKIFDCIRPRTTDYDVASQQTDNNTGKQHIDSSQLETAFKDAIDRKTNYLDLLSCSNLRQQDIDQLYSALSKQRGHKIKVVLFANDISINPYQHKPENIKVVQASNWLEGMSAINKSLSEENPEIEAYRAARQAELDRFYGNNIEQSPTASSSKLYTTNRSGKITVVQDESNFYRDGRLLSYYADIGSNALKV
ncbi:hypothetical protein H0A36_25225 [Endozoicomonas sp. SM1973]|uniref:Uncharacterized protein n=1 Tax=Spartinivicinus marinus TaxID=2994442 RepID=A0A853INB8_9GAMM|nr:hypothetical protein [Spartinivicinus marinus]MCX4027784.1 hypothetical protein [Spartinivicinus marinus]NYZ69326.1 hypothetical protein [Spartinivicinus marinus]